MTHLQPAFDSHANPSIDWGVASRRRHPYYFVARGYSSGELASQSLHRLCSLLNHLGVECWMITTDLSPNLWTPKLTDPVRAAHHRGQRVPLVVVADPKLGSDIELGLKVDYQCAANGSSTWCLTNHENALARQPLPLPFWPPGWPDVDHQVAREHMLAWAPGGPSGNKQWPPGTVELKAADLQDEDGLHALLSKARLLYLYEPHESLSLMARWSGCPVLEVVEGAAPDATPMPERDGCFTCQKALHPDHLPPWSATAFRKNVLRALDGWVDHLRSFVQITQQAADQMPLNAAWPEAITLGLPGQDMSLPAIAQRADRLKTLRVNRQLAQWRERSSLREIDADIYAQHLATGNVPSVSAVVYANQDVDALADTLDSLAQSWLPLADVSVISAQPSPFSRGEEPPGLTWHTVSNSSSLSQTDRGGIKVSAPWTLAIRAGTLIERHSLIEWGLAARNSDAWVIYADDDVRTGDAFTQPNFKPHANLEWLRSCNHLGDAVLVRSRQWTRSEFPLTFDGVYAFALQAIETQGLAALKHVDTLLSHTTGTVSTDQLAAERHHLASQLKRLGLQAEVHPGGVTGLHDIRYRAPNQPITMIVPSATQTGYLDCLLQSLIQHPSAHLATVLVVCELEHADRIEASLRQLPGTPFSVRCVAISNRPYNHARALNAGLAQTETSLVVIADDDTELVHSGWSDSLLGYFQQDRVAIVAPRLVKPGTPEPILCGGPSFLGIAGLWSTYCGEMGNVLESGPYGRLQAAQDVSAWMPHFFAARTSALKAVGGFDETLAPVFFPVLAMALTLQQAGHRAIWTPQVSVLHQGGKTLEDRQRMPEELLHLRQTELQERQALIRRWTHALGADPHYNRNLSLALPFDLEQDIVVDWQPARQDRPRALALPLSSGSGQYRVIEPLHALQNAGRAQSVVVMPISRDISRVPTSIELVRSKLDRLIVQNAIGDLHMARLEEYRKNLPELGVIHMMDDLFGNLPGKHHLHNFHKREGNARIRRALELSDRLIVTTEPLRDYYQGVVPDTRIVPNALAEENWFDLSVTPRPRHGGRLRLGWAGAQQHLGDLDMIAAVVAHFAPQVDWIFMGMCPPSIRPHVKEVHPFVSIAVYPQTLANLDLDIAIAPLEDNPFNACKSNLRLLEYGAMGWPVVCSDVFPYRTAEPPVMRVPNERDAWIHALQGLIDNAELREEMGQSLNHWVKSHFALSQHVDAWYHAIFDPVQRH